MAKPKHFRRRARVELTMRRLLPATVGTGTLLAGLLVVQLGSAGNASSKPVDLAAARTGITHAGRGAPRTSDTAVTAAAGVSSTAAAPTTTSSSSTEAPTTTTTTSAPPPPTTTTPPPPATTAPKPPATVTAAAASGANSQTGGASYYSYKPGGCAHKTLPKGTVVTVTNLSNGKSTTCVVNDRGPYVAGRIIDLDTGVFRQIASTSSGVFQARISW